MSAQLQSSAVMQQRLEPHDSLDDFPTHPWATRALCEMLKAQRFPVHQHSVWDPACNRGFMVRPLGEYFAQAIGTDIHDYGFADMLACQDFLLDHQPPGKFAETGVDWVITNPPFRLGLDFILNALRVARVGVAMFVRVAFNEGIERFERLFSKHPEAYSMPFVERVPLHRGKLRNPNVCYWDPSMKGGAGGWKRPSSATAYQWIVWVKDWVGPTSLLRIPPMRKQMIKPGDYPIQYPDEEGVFTPPAVDQGLLV